MKLAVALIFLLAVYATTISTIAAPPADGPRGKMLRYEQLLTAAKANGIDTQSAEKLNQLSRKAAKSKDMEEAGKLLDQAIADLTAALPASAIATADNASRNSDSRSPRQGERQTTAVNTVGPAGAPQAPVFLIAFTHHYAGPGGYYATPDEVKKTGEIFVKYQIPGTLFFDGILIERLQKEDPALIAKIRALNLPIGYHGEETHGPYPVASELLGEVYTLKEAHGYDGPWSLTSGKDWNTAVKLVMDRYSHSRPWSVDESTRMLNRQQCVETDMTREGGLSLVQKVFGKDVSMMPSHALESAPEGYAFRRMSRFGFDQPAVPVALHALRIFRIGKTADRVMSIAGENESLFWHMGRITCKGDETGEANIRSVRRRLAELDRSRPRLLLVGVSHANDDDFRNATTYLNQDFFPANPASGWVTGDTLPNFFEPEKGWHPTLAEIRMAANALIRDWTTRPPDSIAVGNRVASLCDVYEALIQALAGAAFDGKMPAGVDLHPLYGPVTENGNACLKTSTSVSRGNVIAAARLAVRSMEKAQGDRFIPATTRLPEGQLNAAEFLYAMAQAVAAFDGSPNVSFTVPPSNIFPPYADVLQDVFKPKSIQPLCYTKGQLWTIKPVRLIDTLGKSQTPELFRKTNAVPGAAADVSAGSSRLCLVFASNLDSAEPCYRDAHAGADLYRVDFNPATLQAGNLVRLTSRPGLAEWFPAFSPDRSIVAYDCEETAPGAGNRRSLHLIDTSTGIDTELAKNARFPAFSADNRMLFYSRQSQGAHSLISAPVIKANGYKLGRETPIADSRSLGLELAEDPCPFPDRSAVAFHRKASGSGGAGIALIGTDGKGLQGLTEYDGSGHAAVSPDGKTIACTRSRDGRVILIRRINDNWSAPQELPLSTSASDYVAMDSRFAQVKEVRHSYIEWVAPDAFLLTSHGANGPKSFTFARIFLVKLKGPGQRPELIDVSSAVEALAGKTGKDFCSASGVWIQNQKL